MSSQPAIQYAEFFNQINQSVFNKPPFNPESIKEAQEHIHKNDFDGYLALGMLV